MSLAILTPVIIFLAALLATGYYFAARARRNPDFAREYFVANRTLGGVVLAMTLVATYGSVSSFISGPGLAWQLGYGWVAFASAQVITGFLLLGAVGKKMALISRKINALTVINVLEARYGSRALSVTLALLMLVFFTTMIVGQFVGGAQIFAAIAGLGYTEGLLLFAVVTVLYTAGGFRAVVMTDAVCAVLMIVGMCSLFYVIIKEAGGYASLTATINSLDADGTGRGRLTDVTSHGALPFTLLFSAWVLVGFGTIGLPQSLARSISYRDTRSLHGAMLVATVICGALMIGMTLTGVWARAVITELPENGTDSVIPTLIATRMHPLLAGITIIGPIAATMSTVSSLLILATSAVARDLHAKFTGGEQGGRYRMRVRYITYAIGLAGIALAVYPPDIVVWINLFSFGGLECAFLWPVLLGLFWRRMNAAGAALGLVFGMGTYFLLGVFRVCQFGLHPIVIATAMGLAFSIVGSYLGRGNPEGVDEVFFPHRLPVQA